MSIEGRLKKIEEMIGIGNDEEIPILYITCVNRVCSLAVTSEDYEEKGVGNRAEGIRGKPGSELCSKKVLNILLL